MPLAPPAATRAVRLDATHDAEDKGHSSEWPWCSSAEGSGNTWATVAGDGRLRVFSGPNPSTATLLHSTPVQGAVLAITLWTQQHCVITLEETERPALCSRMIRFYCYDSGEYLELDTALLDPSASRLAAAPQPTRRSARTFSPSLCSFCPSQRMLALADDTQIKVFDLADIFLSATRANGADDKHGLSVRTAEEGEPGACAQAARQSCPVHGPGAVPAPSLSASAAPAPDAAGASAPYYREWVVRVYSPQPVVTLLSPYSIRHLDFKQHYLSYSSSNETRLLCLRLAKQQPRGRSSGEREREEAEREREMHEARMPTSRALSRSGSHASLPSALAAAGGFSQVSPMQQPPRAPSTHRRGASFTPSTPPVPAGASSPAAAAAAASPNQPFEQIGVRCIDDELRMQLRPDMYALECSLVLHRRFSPADQIHTVRLIPSLDEQARRDARAHRSRRDAAAGAGVAAGVNAVAASATESPSYRYPTSSPRPPLSSSHSLSLSQSPAHGGSSVAAPSPSARGLPTVRQELFALLGQGQGSPAQALAVPSHAKQAAGGGSGRPSPSSSFYAASMGGTAGAPPIFVELLDEEEEGGAGQQARIAALIQRLEELEDEAEAEAIRCNGGYQIPSPAAPDSPAPAPSPTSASAPSSPSRADSSVDSSSSSSWSSLRWNGCVDLPVRLLVSTSEECSLYDADASARLVSYVFEHDLVSLHARSSFLFALTTAGLEVHSLWTRHPIAHFLTLPLLVAREEPVQARGADPARKMQDMLLLDDFIILRHSPAPVHSRATSSAVTVGGAHALVGGVGAGAGAGSGSGGLHPSLLSSSPPPRLIVATADTDPCESWPTFPVRALPTVTEVVQQTVQPLALRSMKSSREATPSSIRLFSEALLMLVQRHSQLRSLVRQQRRRGPGLSVALSKLQGELAQVSHALSSTNAYLARLFLSTRELGLSCYFSYYQHETPLTQLWTELNSAVTSGNSSSAGAGAPTSSAMNLSHSRFLTKYLIKLLLYPTRTEQSLLLSSPVLISAFVSHLGTHAPHLLGSVLLQTFLLHCPYDPRHLLRVLEESTQSGEFDSVTDEPITPSDDVPPFHASTRSASGRGGGVSSRSRSPSPSESYGALRMRPIVFNTFVQALMHLQIQSMSMMAAVGATSSLGGGGGGGSGDDSGGGSSGRDCANILLHSFSGQSLEHLLITYSSLLTTWAHRALLIDFLRTSVPASLLEVLVVLTQRGQIHVLTAINLLGGAQATTARLATTNSPIAATGASGAAVLLSPRSAATGVSGLPSSSQRLCAYLEASLNPFMLEQDVGAALEDEHGETILPWEEDDATQQEHFARADAAAPPSDAMEASDDAAADDDDHDVVNPNAPFVPLHGREGSRHRSFFPQTAAVRAETGHATPHGISRGQVACLAEQLTCFYLQQEIAEQQQQQQQQQSPSISLMSSPSNRSSLAAGSMRRVPSYSYAALPALSPSGTVEPRHALTNWWRMHWLDQLGGHNAAAVASASSAAAAASLSPRLRRLQALLCGPLPLSRRHFERIYALLCQLPSRSAADSASSDDSVRLSLLLLVLPRVGRLAAALRLVVAHAPECTWPFALIYCGGSSGLAHTQLQHLVAQPSLHAETPSSLLHWQLLHAVLLLHVYYSTHSQTVLLMQPAGGAGALDEAKGRREPLRMGGSVDPSESSAALQAADVARAKQLLAGLLSPADIDQLLLPLAPGIVGPPPPAASSGPSSSSSVSVSVASGARGSAPVAAELRASASASRLSCSYSGAMAHLPPSSRARLYHDLYVSLVDQLVQRHPPRHFLTFLPQSGSSAFYLPYVQRNLALHAAATAASKHAKLLAQDSARRPTPATPASVVTPGSARASAPVAASASLSAHGFGGL